MVGLSLEQITQFKKDGYLVIEDFLSDPECDVLKHKIFDVTDTYLDLATHPRTVFTTYSAKEAAPDKHMAADYFLSSGDCVKFFFEEGAFSESGELVVPKHAAINKIGHALHTDVEEYKAVAQGQGIQNICRSLDMEHPILPQSMYIFKSPGGLGGEVTPHKDSSFLHTGGTRLLGLWIPLDDADVNNGCLWFIPGSHCERASLHMNRKCDNSGCEFVGTPNNFAEGWVAVEVKRGSLVLIDGDVSHKSERNTSQRERNAFTFHLYEGQGANWRETNWNQPTDKGTFVQLY